VRVFLEGFSLGFMFSSNELLFNRKKGEWNIKGCREEGKSRHTANVECFIGSEM
jgi:hypothetical protein